MSDFIPQDEVENLEEEAQDLVADALEEHGGGVIDTLRGWLGL